MRQEHGVAWSWGSSHEAKFYKYIFNTNMSLNQADDAILQYRFFFLIESLLFCLIRWRRRTGKKKRNRRSIIQFFVSFCYEVEADPSSNLAFFVLWITGGATFPRTPTSGPPSGSTARLLFVPVPVSVPSSVANCFPFPFASALRSLSLLLSPPPLPPRPPRPPRPRPPRPRPPRPPPSPDELKAWRAAAWARSISNCFSSSSIHSQASVRIRGLSWKKAIKKTNQLEKTKLLHYYW